MEAHTYNQIREIVRKAKAKLLATSESSFVADAVEDLCFAVGLLISELDRIDSAPSKAEKRGKS